MNTAHLGTKAPPEEKKSRTGAVGFLGFQHYRGIITEEYLSDLQGVRKVTIYQKMRADGTVQAMLAALRLPVVAASWVVEPGGKDAKALQAADLVQRQLFEELGCCWEDEVRQLLGYLIYGFHVSALNWQIRKGEVAISEMRPLHPKTLLQGGRNWDFDVTGRVAGVWQSGYDGSGDLGWREEYIPGEAMLHLAWDSEYGDPEGRSILRGAYKHWHIKDKLYLWDAIGHERGAVGVPWISYPEGTPDAVRDDMEAFAKNVAVGEKAYAIFPSGTELNCYENKARTEELFKSITHHDALMAQSVLAGFLKLGQEGKGGAYALSADQTDLFLLALQGTADYVASRINRTVIRKLVDLNIGTDQYPKLSATVARGSASALAALVQPLVSGAGAPVTWSEADEDWLREQLQLPERTEQRPKPQDPADIEKPGENPPDEEKPAKVDEKLSRERIELPMAFADPASFREEPAYPELGRTIDQFHGALTALSSGLKAQVWAIAGLPEIEGQQFRNDRFPQLTKAQEAALDAAIEQFLIEYAGEDRSEKGFVGTESEDALLQSFLRLGHSVGVQRATQLTGAQPAAAVTRNSPEIRRLLTQAFRRLSKGSELKIGGQLDAIREVLIRAGQEGTSSLEVAKQLEKRFTGFERHEWDRLARTEMAFAANGGQLDQGVAEGVQMVEPLISALACAICQSHRGKRIPIEKAVVGENIAPYHPHCLDSFTFVVDPAAV